MTILQRRVISGPAAVVLLAVLTACGQQGAPVSGETGDHRGTPSASSTPSLGRSGAPVVVDVHLGVSYYGACGNEVLQYRGRTYWPMLPEELEGLDLQQQRALLAPPDSPSSAQDSTHTDTARQGVVVAAAALPLVAPPGPGDDTGTLTVFSDEVAHFISDSGNETWLTTASRSYGWVC